MQRPVQYIPVGYPFSGKTSLSRELERRLGFSRVNIDEIKSEFGYENKSDDYVPDKVWQSIFDEIERKVSRYLKEGKSVINETAWITKEWRDKARKIASDLGFETKIIYIKVSLEVARSRWIKNKTTKERFDITRKVFEDAIREFEPPAEYENFVIYDQTMPLQEWINKNIA